MSKPPKDSPIALEDTLPGVRRESVRPSAPRTNPTPDADFVSSAPVSSYAATSQTSGTVTMSGVRVLEAVARELILRRFEQAGVVVSPDYSLHEDELLVRLDGFDPTTRVGFQFLSHSDADVVTDFDDEVEAKLAHLSSQGRVHVLVIHDHQAPTADVILERVEAFLRRLGR